MDRNVSPAASSRIDRLLRQEPVVWLSSVRPDGRPHVVPIWFSWDGGQVLIASKPNAQKACRQLKAKSIDCLVFQTDVALAMNAAP